MSCAFSDVSDQTVGDYIQFKLYSDNSISHSGFSITYDTELGM